MSLFDLLLVDEPMQLVELVHLVAVFLGMSAQRALSNWRLVEIQDCRWASFPVLLLSQFENLSSALKGANCFQCVFTDALLNRDILEIREVSEAGGLIALSF